MKTMMNKVDYFKPTKKGIKFLHFDPPLLKRYKYVMIDPGDETFWPCDGRGGLLALEQVVFPRTKLHYLLKGLGYDAEVVP